MPPTENWGILNAYWQVRLPETSIESLRVSEQSDYMGNQASSCRQVAAGLVGIHLASITALTRAQ